MLALALDLALSCCDNFTFIRWKARSSGENDTRLPTILWCVDVPSSGRVFVFMASFILQVLALKKWQKTVWQSGKEENLSSYICK